MKEGYRTLALGLLALAGCGKQPKAGPAAETPPGMMMVPDTGETELRSVNPTGMSLVLTMQAHIDSMTRMTPEQMSRGMARHQQMMAQMLEQTRGDVRHMQAPQQRQWSALTDSVKQDLAQLPSLNGTTLSTRMQAHADRVRRLLGMHKLMSLGM
jgi:TolA-binding protein